MKPVRSSHHPAGADTPAPPRLDRRGLVVGAGVVAGSALAAAALHRSVVEAPVAAAAKPAQAAGDGYQLTEHVLRYYRTARA